LAARLPELSIPETPERLLRLSLKVNSGKVLLSICLKEAEWWQSRRWNRLEYPTTGPGVRLFRK
jgi:hypothetical protein